MPLSFFGLIWEAQRLVLLGYLKSGALEKLEFELNRPMVSRYHPRVQLNNFDQIFKFIRIEFSRNKEFSCSVMGVISVEALIWL